MCHRWMLRDSAMAIRATLRRSAAAPVAVAAGAALLSRHRGQSIVSAVSLSRAPRCTPIASGSRELSREAKPGSGGGRTTVNAPVAARRAENMARRCRGSS